MTCLVLAPDTLTLKYSDIFDFCQSNPRGTFSRGHYTLNNVVGTFFLQKPFTTKIILFDLLNLFYFTLREPEDLNIDTLSRTWNKKKLL